MGDLSRNFSRYEFACKCGCGFDFVDAELIKVLEQVRFHFDKSPITITSGCRCETHNQKVGGSAYSKHIKGIAADFKVKGVHADEVASYLERTYPDKYGIGRYKGRTHIDIRKSKARWDKR